MVPLSHAVGAMVARQLWPEAEPRWLSEDRGTKLSSSPSRASPRLTHGDRSCLSCTTRGSRLPGDTGQVELSPTGQSSRSAQPGAPAQGGRASRHTPLVPVPPTRRVPPFCPQAAPAHTCGAANLPLPAGAGARGRAGRAGPAVPRFLLPVPSLSMSSTGKSLPFPEGSSKPFLGRWALWLLWGHLHRW